MSLRSTRLLPAVVLVAGVLLLAGCGVEIPADPDGTLRSVRSSGELTVGVSPHPPFVTLPDGTDGPPAGSEVDLVTGFARSLSAEPVWVVGGEEHLMRQLEEGEVDVVVGGLTARSPWGANVALTRPYLTTVEDGQKTDHVMAVVPGENALLSALERYLDGRRP